MVGIVASGGYVPRLRLNRASAVQQFGWFAPAIMMAAQGERSFGNWDEDSLTMAVAAARDCLIGRSPAEVDALYLGSTTLPFADRSNAGIVKEALALRDDILAADFTSCQKAGTTALITALETVAQKSRRAVLVATADQRLTKTANFNELWFGDGAAAFLVGDGDVMAEYGGSFSVTHDFVDHYRAADKTFDYYWEERWLREEGYGRIVPEAVNGLLKKLGLTAADIDRLIFPCLFKAEHRQIAGRLGVPPEKAADTLFAVCGETGAAHPLLMLAGALENAKPGERLVVAGFGQGCDALLFRVTDRPAFPAGRKGLQGSLANRRETDNHAKYLVFRDLVQTEMGIRAEAPTQTAMTALWRKRRMLHALIGGRCTQCGTVQFPKMDLCVNPQCLAQHSQEEYRFADKPARIKSFTGDLLAVSVDPPAIYGMIEFEGGGRMIADFTDCELADLSVGHPVTMAFRRRLKDRQRGFYGYFWKAVPLPPDRSAPAAPASELSVAEVFALMQAGFRADKATGLDVVFQYRISGAAGGKWHIVVREGACTIHEGEHPSPTTVLSMADRDFVAIAIGKLNAMEAFSGGKLKIDGDLMKSQLIGKLFRLEVK